MGTVAKRLIDQREVERAYHLLVNPGQVVEVRALEASLITDKLPYNKPRVMNGWFTNVKDLIASISPISEAAGIYITINPCLVDLLAKVNNRLTGLVDKATTGTQDEQIVKRRILFIDLDPERPGKIAGIPSNDSEHQLALERAQFIKDALTSEGWPAPLHIDSGNGAYLDYAIDLPADDEGLIQRVLAGLAKRYDIDAVHIDQTAFNQSRIMRLPGTWNCKGDGTPDRTHRQAYIIEAPDTLLPVSRALLEFVAAPVDVQQPSSPQATQEAPQQRTSKFDMDAFLSKHNIEVVSSGPYRGGTRYKITECPFCKETDHNACVYDTPFGPGFSCSHNRCKDLVWHDFREYFEPGYKDYRQQTTTSRQSYKITSLPVELDYILACLNENEYGDARLFASVFSGRVCYDHLEKEWYLFHQHYWEQDKTGQIALLISGELGSVYLRACATINLDLATITNKLPSKISDALKSSDSETKKLAEEAEKLEGLMEALRNRAKSLRTAKRNKNVQMFIQSMMAVTSNMWDTDPWLLGTVDGVIELKTGVIRDGRPDDYIRTVSPTHWNGLDAVPARFEQFLHEIFGDRSEADRNTLLAFLQRLLGYSITGLSTEAIFPMLWGNEGRNGKDTLFKFIKRTLGPLAGAITNDVLLAQEKGKSAGAATPHLVELQGKRLVWGSETEKGAKLNGNQIKLITGGGDIPARQVFGKFYSFTPSHTLFLMTNHRPHADASDPAFWSRACLIVFNIRYVDDPTKPNEHKPDTQLYEKLNQEAPAFLAWLVRGCLQWQQEGFNMPEHVRLATQEYRADEDTLSKFFQDRCVIRSGVEAMAGQLYTAYMQWCKDNSLSYMNGISFGKEMKNRFGQPKKAMKGLKYIGIGILEETAMQGMDEPCIVDEAAPQANSNTNADEVMHSMHSFSITSPQNAEPTSKMGVINGKTMHTMHQVSSDILIESASQVTLDGISNPAQPCINPALSLENVINTLRVGQMVSTPDGWGHITRLDNYGVDIDCLGRMVHYTGARILTIKAKEA
jgi:putative DNA primase/helicase